MTWRGFLRRFCAGSHFSSKVSPPRSYYIATDKNSRVVSEHALDQKMEKGAGSMEDGWKQGDLVVEVKIGDRDRRELRANIFGPQYDPWVMTLWSMGKEGRFRHSLGTLLRYLADEVEGEPGMESILTLSRTEDAMLKHLKKHEGKLSFVEAINLFRKGRGKPPNSIGKHPNVEIPPPDGHVYSVGRRTLRQDADFLSRAGLLYVYHMSEDEKGNPHYVTAPNSSNGQVRRMLTRTRNYFDRHMI